jgi:hypothetical protein
MPARPVPRCARDDRSSRPPALPACAQECDETIESTQRIPWKALSCELAPSRLWAYSVAMETPTPAPCSDHFVRWALLHPPSMIAMSQQLRHEVLLPRVNNPFAWLQNASVASLRTCGGAAEASSATPAAAGGQPRVAAGGPRPHHPGARGSIGGGRAAEDGSGTGAVP